MAQSYDAGLQAYEEGDYVTALSEFIPLAEEEDATAQYYLGEMYYYGDGLRRNFEEAARWYRMAAEQGNAIAQYKLGEMYFRGYGVPQDFEETIRWLRMAAEQGHVDAQNSLGYMYSSDEWLRDFEESTR